MAEIEAKEGVGRKPLHKAAMSDSEEHVAKKIKFSLDDLFNQIHDQDEDGRTPLHKAVVEGNTKKVKFLLNLGADIEAKQKNESTPLHLAAITRVENVDVVALLIEAGAQIDAKDFKGRTPLHDAFLEVSKLLVEKGAQIDAKDNKGQTPLALALDGYPAVAKYLIEKGADLKEIRNCSIWRWAIKAQNGLELVRFIHQKGAQINVPDKKGMYPLHFNPSLEIAKWLIENGANVNAKSSQGSSTALHFLAFEKYNSPEEEEKIEIAKLLIQNGAEANARDNRNQTPFDHADENQNFELAHYLLEVKKEADLKNRPSTNAVQDDNCIICLTPKIGTYAVIPCGHAVLCEPCWYKLKRQNHANCPSCRAKITSFTKIFS